MNRCSQMCSTQWCSRDADWSQSWIPRGRSLVRTIIQWCVTCHRHEGAPFPPPPLPVIWAKEVLAFSLPEWTWLVHWSCTQIVAPRRRRHVFAYSFALLSERYTWTLFWIFKQKLSSGVWRDLLRGGAYRRDFYLTMAKHLTQPQSFSSPFSELS